MDEEQMQSEIKDLFGITDEAPASENNPPVDDSSATDNTPEVNDHDEPADEGAPATDVEVEKSGKKEPAPTPKDNKPQFINPEEKFNSKANAAFAEMRTQNKQLSDLIIGLAKATGQDPHNVGEASEILKNSLNTINAKRQNIPEEILREMENDKRELESVRQEQRKSKVLSDFQKVKDLHKLSDEEFNEFTDQLVENNLNPYTRDIDLVSTYRNLNFDKLIAKAIETGIQQERLRARKAQTSSTKPNVYTGAADNTGNQGKSINSVKDLEALFDSSTR